jgi:uncharacterized membrane protein
MLFDWLAFNQVQSHGSLLMSFDWSTIKSRCRVTDHCSCHLIGWHSNPGAESLISVHAILLVGIQSQVPSHGSLFMSFDWLAFKVKCRVTDQCSCHFIGWHSKPGAESRIIVNVI